MTNLKKYYKYHILGWLIFGFYEVSAVAVVTGSLGRWEDYMEHYPFNILLFYLHGSFLLPYIFQTGKKSRLALFVPLLILQLACYLGLNYAADYLMGNPALSYFSKSGIRWPFFFGSLWRAIYFMGFATTYFFLNRHLTSSRKIALLEKQAIEKILSEKQLALELADSRNAHLRAQVNPHFLMNTLSFIYNRTRDTEPYTADAVFYLSKILRYIINSDNGPAIIPIGPEIEQTENLFQLCRIKNVEIYIELNYSEEIENVEIIPVILLTLAENMIKHGDLSQKESPGKIDITLNSSVLHISTRNLINTGINDIGNHSGLDNIRKRLVHTYGRLAKISYGLDTDRYFFVDVFVTVRNKH